MFAKCRPKIASSCCTRCLNVVQQSFLCLYINNQACGIFGIKVHCLKSQFLEIRTLGPPIKKPRVGEHEFPAVQSQPVAFWLRSIWFTWFHMVPRSPRSPSIQQISTRSETWLRMAEICWELLRYLTFQDFRGLSECTSTGSRSPDEGTTRNPLSWHLRTQVTFMQLSVQTPKESHADSDLLKLVEAISTLSERLALTLRTFPFSCSSLELHYRAMFSLQIHGMVVLLKAPVESTDGIPYVELTWIVVNLGLYSLQSVRTNNCCYLGCVSLWWIIDNHE